MKLFGGLDVGHDRASHFVQMWAKNLKLYRQPSTIRGRAVPIAVNPEVIATALT